MNCLFVAVSLTKNADIDKHKYSGCDIGFDRYGFGKGPTPRLEHKLSSEKMYSINFTENNKKYFLTLHYNGAKRYLFVKDTEIHKFQAKDFKIVATPLYLANISMDWIVDNM